MNHPEEKTDTSLGVRLSSKNIAKLDFAWKVVVAALLLLNLFMKTQYVSQGDYKSEQQKTSQENAVAHAQMQEAIVQLKTLVATMEVKNEVNQRQDSVLQDHENRVRAMENAKKR